MLFAKRSTSTKGIEMHAFGRLVWVFLSAYPLLYSAKVLSSFQDSREKNLSCEKNIDKDKVASSNVSSSESTVSLPLSDYEVKVTSLNVSLSESTVSLPLTNYDLAEKESNGFFKDTSNSEWKLLKKIAHEIQPNTLGDPNEKKELHVWFQEQFEPEFSCQFERRIGRKGDGGKWVCDPHRILEDGSDCLVYSIGSNGDASFEASVLKEISPDCEIHVFDFGDFEDTVKEQTGHVSNVYYHQWGIDGKADNAKNIKSFDDTIKELGHEERIIDLFKIDCEGCEINSLKLFVDASVTLRQIMVEIHPTLEKLEKLGTRGRWREKLSGMWSEKKGLPETVDLFRSLHERGYAITHKESNTLGCRGDCIEYSFLLLSTDFWEPGDD